MSFPAVVDMSGLVSGLMDQLTAAFTSIAPALALILGLGVAMKFARKVLYGEDYGDDSPSLGPGYLGSGVDDDGVTVDHYDQHSSLDYRPQVWDPYEPDADGGVHFEEGGVEHSYYPGYEDYVPPGEEPHPFDSDESDDWGEGQIGTGYEGGVETSYYGDVSEYVPPGEEPHPFDSDESDDWGEGQIGTGYEDGVETSYYGDVSNLDQRDGWDMENDRLHDESNVSDNSGYVAPDYPPYEETEEDREGIPF